MSNWIIEALGPSISSRISTNGELTRYWWIGWFTTTVHPAYKARRYKAIPVIWQMIWLTQMRPSFVIMLGYKAIPLIWPIFIVQNYKIVGLISGLHCVSVWGEKQTMVFSDLRLSYSDKAIRLMALHNPSKQDLIHFGGSTVLIGYYDYPPVTKFPKIGYCDCSQIPFYYSRIISLWQLSACQYFLAVSRGSHNIW